jgi:hypothetical protein
MIYSLSLRNTGLLVGLFVFAVHAVALIHAQAVKNFLQSFPRSRTMGTFLLLLDAVWAFALVAQIDLGEFTAYREIFLGIIAIGSVLTLLFVQEFLAVRALGMACLLVAEPLLEVTFLRPELSRLLLSLLAYGWATLGLFWVGMPYLLRDQIEWVSKTDLRWRVAALGGVVYGVAIWIAALTQYGA